MSCSHNKTSFKKVDIDYFGMTFSADMEVCGDCDSYLWTQESKDQLNHWLADRKKTHRDHFVIQAALSNHSRNCLEEIGKNHPGVPTSTLIRAMALVFLHFMEEPEFAELFEAVEENDVYESFLHGGKSITKVQFSPSAMLDLQSWSKILHMKPSKIVEEAIYRVTTMYIGTKPELRNFWENHILPQISLILKSAA